MAKSKVNNKAKEVVDTQEVTTETQVLTLVGSQKVIGAKIGTLTEGKEYDVTAEMAMILINKGFATLKNK